MQTQIIYSQRPGWIRYRHQKLEIFARSAPAALSPLLAELTAQPMQKEQVIGTIANVKDHFAVIVRGPNFCFACTDHCRSSPIFFSSDAISNDAHALKLQKNINRPNIAGVRDAAMAGFVTGPKILYVGLQQLEAGTCALWKTDQQDPDIWKHTTYLPQNIQNISLNSLTDGFLAVMDSAVKRGIEEAAGKPILLALSGGLDSRLLLAKFVQHGCPNLSAFTYGPSGSDEARIAREIASRLNVPWSPYFTKPRHMKAFFSTPERRKYWAFCDGLTSVPNFQDFLPLKLLQEQGRIPQGTFIINGQTGDYISGGHIPRILMAPSVPGNTLLTAIIEKHFSLWKSLKTPENLNAVQTYLAERFKVDPHKSLDREESIAIYERFEYEERQSKYVVNGQRNYEFLGLNWLLPFWQSDVVRFWRDVPLDAKYRQKLYRTALEAWNYSGIFKDIKTTVSHWPGMMRAILGPSRLLRLTFGHSVRDAYLKRMLYFGLYQDQYAPFGYINFLRHSSDLRNPVSLLSRAWLADLNMPSFQK